MAVENSVLAIFDIRLSIVLTFSIFPYPVWCCLGIFYYVGLHVFDVLFSLICFLLVAFN